MSEARAQSESNANDSLSGFREGCLFWIGFTVVALVIRGVRWDENYEFAQAMTGLVPYDDAHPLRQYTRAAYNLQFYSSALILNVSENPLVLNGFRNLLFIASTVLPPFMLGAWLSRNAWVGHCAAVLILLGVHLEFDGVYPQFLWPGMFSNGHVGLAYALIFAGCLAAGHLRCAGLLLGLMPMIHLGQIPPALALAGLYAIYCVRKNNLQPLKNAVIFFSVGVVLCTVFYVIQQQFVLPPVTDGPYFSDADPRPIWQGRITSHDMHRQIPTGNIHVITVATLLIGWLGWFRLHREESRIVTVWFWIALYATSVIVITYAIMVIHLALGADIPYLLLGWLPYRLLNHLPPILVVMGLTVLTRIADDDSSKSFPALFVSGCVMFAALKPLLPYVVGSDLYSRYLFHNDLLLFALVGIASAFLSIQDRRATISLLIGWIVLAVLHRYGAAIVLVSGLITFGLLRNIVSFEFESSRWAMILVAAIGLITILWPQYQNREHLPVGIYEADVAEILDARGDGDALLLARPQQVLLQAQTGHPVFADMATEFHASYRPSLGPSIKAMYEEVYGIWFEDRGEAPPGWQTTWSAHTPEHWTDIRDRWNIEYVIVPNSVVIQLEPVLRGELDKLYALPE